MVEKREFAHHMIKEIFEQPQGLHDTIAPRISLPDGVVQLNEVPIRREEFAHCKDQYCCFRDQPARRDGRAIHDRGIRRNSGGRRLRQRIRVPQSDDWAGAS